MARPAVLTVADTIAKSFLLAVETRGDRSAIREKKFGIWQPTSWREWLRISKEIAYALHAVGLLPGDVASIMANAVPEWVFADMGILCAGGVSSEGRPAASTDPKAPTRSPAAEPRSPPPRAVTPRSQSVVGAAPNDSSSSEPHRPEAARRLNARRAAPRQGSGQ